MSREIERYAAEPEEDSLNWAQIYRFIEAPRRRPWLVVVPWVAVIVASAVALYMMPRKYRSSTLILVESQRMPDSFVPRVATDDRSARLEAIRPEILSRTRLEQVLEETQPFPDVASKTRAVENMLSATSINVSGNDGFTIAFVHKDAKMAQEVTARLASLFIEETIKSREEQVEGAVDFLIKQVAEARKELEKKDEALRVYKQGHMGRLPEQLQTNLATMGMLQRELQTVEESLLFARERQESLARGAARPSASGTPEAGGSSIDLLELRRQLAAMSGRYTDEHPDVQRLRARIARLEARMADSSTGGGAQDVVTREQIERANLEIKRLEDKRTNLEGRIANMRANVEDTPRTEQELATLMRDYQKLNENYVALLSKQMDAQMAGRLEKRWKGDRFRILDPANLPERPYSPKPFLILGLGLALGLMAGLAASVAAELLDPSVKAVQDLEALAGYPILASIPHLPLSVAPTRR